MADNLKAPDANSIIRLDGASGLRAAFDYAGGGMPTAHTLRPAPYRWCDASALPKRQWLMGRYLLRGAVSMTIGSGGTGKSTLTLTETVALASGRDLLRGGVEDCASVWYWNLEEPMDELSRRVQAICQHYNVKELALAGTLYVDSGLDRPLCLARPGHAGQCEIIDDVFTGLETAIREQAIDVLVIDPFVSSHRLDENNNMQMDALVKRLSRLAAGTDCAVSLIHHTRKPGPDGKTITESARGAKAMTDASRIVRVLNPITNEQAERFGVEGAGYLSTHLDKQNFATGGDSHNWFRLESVQLGNGDEVGVVTLWSPPNMMIELSAIQIAEIQKRCGEEVPGANIQAGDWAGKIIASVLGLNLCDTAEKKRVNAVLKQLLRKGYLKEERRPKPRKVGDRPVILPGREQDE